MTERNSALFAVEALYEYIKLVADGNDVFRIGDVKPCKLGAMYHAVNSAEINKYSVRGHALYGACVVLAYFDLVPESFFTSLAFFACYNADRTENSAT